MKVCLYILIEYSALGGYVYKTSIYRKTLCQLKISTVTTAVLKLQYQYHSVFYQAILHTD